MREERPDLVLLDLMLPGLSGEEVLARIPEVPVIALSAKAAVQDKVDVLLGGAVDYMTKPFDTAELLARIKVQHTRRKERIGVSDLSSGPRNPSGLGAGSAGSSHQDGICGF